MVGVSGQRYPEGILLTIRLLRCVEIVLKKFSLPSSEQVQPTSWRLIHLSLNRPCGDSKKGASLSERLYT